MHELWRFEEVPPAVRDEVGANTSVRFGVSRKNTGSSAKKEIRFQKKEISKVTIFY